jgi:type VI protein secretion system component VasK
MRGADDEEIVMKTKMLPRLVLATLMAGALSACSSSTGSGSGGASPGSPTAASTATTSAGTTTTAGGTGTAAGGTGTAASGTVCPALADVKSSAATLTSDLQARKLSAVSADVSNLEAAFTTLLSALSSGAAAGAAELQSAWDNVKNTFQGLSKSDIGKVQSTMQGPIQQLRTALDSMTNGLNCS